MVLEGSIAFILPEEDRAVTRSAGDRLAIPAGKHHAAIVGERGVTCWEVQAGAGPAHVGARGDPGWQRDGIHSHEWPMRAGGAMRAVAGGNRGRCTPTERPHA